MQPIGCHTNKIIIIIISGTTRPGIFTNFLVHVTYTAVARSSSGGVAISLNMGKVVQSRRTLALQNVSYSSMMENLYKGIINGCKKASSKLFSDKTATNSNYVSDRSLVV